MPAPRNTPIENADNAQVAVSDDDKAKAAADAAAADAAHTGKGKHVLYLGPSNIARAVENDEFKKRAPVAGEGTVAEITPAQWAEVGLKSERTAPHVWDLSNEWQIPATQFTEGQLEYLAGSPRFAVVDDAKADA